MTLWWVKLETHICLIQIEYEKTKKNLVQDRESNQSSKQKHNLLFFQLFHSFPIRIRANYLVEHAKWKSQVHILARLI